MKGADPRRRAEGLPTGRGFADRQRYGYLGRMCMDSAHAHAHVNVLMY